MFDNKLPKEGFNKVKKEAFDLDGSLFDGFEVNGGL
jgi:hypothetical protein